MTRRRRVRIHCHAPDARPFIVEQDTGRARAQLRIWLPVLKRYRRMTIPFNLLQPDPDGSTRAAAVQHALERVLTEASLNVAPGDPPTRGGTNGTSGDQPPTLGETLDLACAPGTTRKRKANSGQHGEWKRARCEVLAVLLADLPLAELSGQHFAVVAKASLLRRAAGLEVDEWRELVATQVVDAQRYDALHLDAAVEAAYCLRAPLVADGQRDVTKRWSELAVDLLRAMIRHLGKRHIRFRDFRDFTTPVDVMNDVDEVATRLGVALAQPFRPRRYADEAQGLMRELSDPRYCMRDALATMIGREAPMRVRASEVRITGDGAEVYCRRREKYAHRKAWHPCEAAVAAVLKAQLTGPYRELEAARAAGGPDYRLVADVRWTGQELRRIRAATDAPDDEDDQLLDSRTWLLLTLGAEGRMGQVLRARRSNIHVEGTSGELLLAIPHAPNKRASWLLMAPSQQAALAFTLRAGYLADLERAFRNGELSDSPHFPKGELVRGRARLDVSGIVNDRTMNSWARDVEERLSIARVLGEGMYGWRRCFVNLFDSWSTSARVKDLITGHTDTREPEHGSTRVTVYLDPRDLGHLREGQRLLEHVRTEFMRTGAPPAPAGDGAR